jgi:hypothetical protein
LAALAILLLGEALAIILKSIGSGRSSPPEPRPALVE